MAFTILRAIRSLHHESKPLSGVAFILQLCYAMLCNLADFATTDDCLTALTLSLTSGSEVWI